MNFITDALANDTTPAVAAKGASPTSGLMSLFPFVIIFFIFYFMLIKPQMKKHKEHQALVNTLKKGDKIVTSGGIVGTIAKIDDDIIHVEISPDIKIKVLKNSVTELYKTEEK
jgi:preprotein translocase subunit YajC